MDGWMVIIPSFPFLTAAATIVGMQTATKQQQLPFKCRNAPERASEPTLLSLSVCVANQFDLRSAAAGEKGGERERERERELREREKERTWLVVIHAETEKGCKQRGKEGICSCAKKYRR
jgi:hypothetical protein